MPAIGEGFAGIASDMEVVDAGGAVDRVKAARARNECPLLFRITAVVGAVVSVLAQDGYVLTTGSSVA